MKAPAPIIIAVFSLGSGGVTTAVLTQSTALTEAGHSVTIVTFNQDPSFAEMIQSLRVSGRLSEHVVVRNLHVESAGELKSNSRSRPHAPNTFKHRVARRLSRALRTESGFVTERTQGDRLTRSYFTKHGVLRDSETFSQSGELLESSLHSTTGYVETFKYSQGYCYLAQKKMAPSPHPFAERYFAPDGFCYLSRTLNPASGVGTAAYSFTKGRQKAEHFRGIPNWQQAWFQHIVDEVNQQNGLPIVIGQAPSVLPKVARLNQQRAIRIGMLHNNHNSYPHTPGSDLRDDHADIFSLANTLDALVILSETQRQDITAHHNILPEKLHVIPNIVTTRGTAQATRDSNLVGIISRLADLKQLDHALRAFQLVQQEHPAAKLAIWGTGPSEKTLRALVDELNIKEHVTFLGFTSNVDEAYSSCAVTVLSSLSEALPLSIAEAALNETPTVAYDCYFGPRALIAPNETGILVPPGDQAAMAQAILSLLQNPTRTQAMGRTARYRVEENFSAHAVVTKWEALFESISESRGE